LTLAAALMQTEPGFLSQVVDLFLHLDVHLADAIAKYGAWTYGILFLIVFCETGLVVTPILPGDSLLFAAGSLAALGNLNPWLIGALLFTAAVLGNGVNYHVGKYFAGRTFKPDARFLKKKYLDRTHDFYERYGPMTVVIAQFVPIVRTFAPFVAGMGGMSYPRFFAYNVLGATLWVGICVTAGYLLGNVPFVRDHFTLVILAIIVVSLIPAIVGLLNARRKSARTAS
jgi:membrane-associated protein